MDLFRKFKKRSSVSPIGLLLDSPGVVIPTGYHSLADAPEVAAAVWRISDMISSVTIRLMENTEEGDVRVRDKLGKFVDITPWSLGTRQTLVSWIVSTMLTEGEAFVLPRTESGLLADLIPMPGAESQERPDGSAYEVQWKSWAFEPDEVLHFRLRPDPGKPWRGIGPRVQLQSVVESLLQTGETKKAYMSTEYKPPVVVSVNSDSDLSDPEKRTTFVEKYMKRKNLGEPLIIPADLMNVSQIKPLSLTDLAIKDGVELDKRIVSAIYGTPGYMVGVGKYDKEEQNSFIRTILVTICEIITQELTKKLLISPNRYFSASMRRLYDYDLQTLANIGKDMRAAGLMSGNEVRDWIGLSPKKGLDELVMLENYIPTDKLGDQKKLKQEGEK